MAFRIFTSMLRMLVNILPLFTSISENDLLLNIGLFLFSDGNEFFLHTCSKAARLNNFRKKVY